MPPFDHMHNRLPEDSIGCAPRRGAFERIVLNQDIGVDDDEFVDYVTAAVLIADKCGKHVHIQDVREMTIHVVFPEKGA